MGRCPKPTNRAKESLEQEKQLKDFVVLQKLRKTEKFSIKSLWDNGKCQLVATLGRYCLDVINDNDFTQRNQTPVFKKIVKPLFSTGEVLSGFVYPATKESTMLGRWMEDFKKIQNERDNSDHDHGASQNFAETELDNFFSLLDELIPLYEERKQRIANKASDIVPLVPNKSGGGKGKRSGGGKGKSERDAKDARDSIVDKLIGEANNRSKVRVLFSCFIKLQIVRG